MLQSIINILTRPWTFMFLTTHFDKQRLTSLQIQTRMHSSRMRTGRSLTVCWSVLPRGGVWSGGSAPGGVSAPGGCVCLLRGVSAPRGVSLPREGVLCLLRGGVCSPRGSPCPGGGSPCLGGFSLPGDPPVNRITHKCKNITLATTSLRPVNTPQTYLQCTKQS